MTRPPEPIVCGHPDRPHYARGFCKPCYERDYRRLVRERRERLERRLREFVAA